MMITIDQTNFYFQIYVHLDKKNEFYKIVSILYLTKNSNVGTIKNIITHKCDWYIEKYSIKKWIYADKIIPKV